MTKFLDTFLRDDGGATAIEYALIAALISIACIAGALAVGISVQGLFQAVVDAFTGI